MVACTIVPPEEVQAFADELDTINERSIAQGPEAPERISQILEAHAARCAELARAEERGKDGVAHHGRQRHS